MDRRIGRLSHPQPTSSLRTPKSTAGQTDALPAAVNPPAISGEGQLGFGSSGRLQWTGDEGN